jgi:excinuclease ABC subunit C
VRRRFVRLKKGEYQAPDILFIDGGKGQVTEAQKALKELQINEVATLNRTHNLRYLKPN